MAQLICSMHGKPRSMMCLADNGDGTYSCKPGFECKGSGAGGGIKRTLCKFWQQGICAKGDDCTFSHDPNATPAQDTFGGGGGKGCGCWGKGGGDSWGGKGGGGGALGWGGGGDMWSGGKGDMMWNMMKGMMMSKGCGKGGKGKDAWGGGGGGGGWGGGPIQQEEKIMCSIHNKLRSKTNLQDMGDGSFVCQPGNECHGFGHGGIKRAICKFHQSGQCTRGEACAFAHSESEIGSMVPVLPPEVVASMTAADGARQGGGGFNGGGMGGGKGGMDFGGPIGGGPIGGGPIGGGGKGGMGPGMEHGGGQLLCSTHNKMRSASNLQDMGDGMTFACKPGCECRDASAGTKQVPCKFYMQGICQKGEQCPFSHDGGMGMGMGMGGGGGQRMAFMSGGPGGNAWSMSGSSGVDDDTMADVDGFGGFMGSMMGGMPGMGGMQGMGGMPGMSFGGSSASRPTRRRRRVPPYVMESGTPVIIHGLEKAKEHNGKVGRVLSFDEQRGRYEVEVDREAATVLSLRPQSLTQQTSVEVVGLESKPELNGRTGDVYNYDETAGRYLVLLQNPPAAVSLQRGNCILRPGMPVVLTGLSKQQFNGQMAQIVGVEKPSARYVVRCQNGSEIKIKYENVLC